MQRSWKPGFEALKFCQVLRRLKKRWNHSNQKYATFWDPTPVLQRLSTRRSLASMSVPELRERLIILFRVLALYRGVDLARTQRTISLVQDRCFVLLRRKGWLFPKWEQVLKFDEDKSLSPFHLMQTYVAKTARFSVPGGPLLLSLDGKKALSSDRINSLTKKILQRFGIPPSWTAHSTRGAGVFMYKSLGLSQEEVAEIGQWKNLQAFSSHYLRINAVDRVKNKLKNVLHPYVHTPSPPESAEPEWSHTPPTKDRGGSDQEGEAQEGGGPNLPRPKRKASKSPPRSKKFSIRAGGPHLFRFTRPVSEPPTPAPK